MQGRSRDIQSLIQWNSVAETYRTQHREFGTSLQSYDLKNKPPARRRGCAGGLNSGSVCRVTEEARMLSSIRVMPEVLSYQIHTSLYVG